MLYFIGIVTTAIVGVATYLVFHTTKRQITLPPVQSREVEGEQPKTGEGIPRTSLQDLSGQAPTVHHVFTRAVEKYANKPCYGYRPFLNIIKEEKNINGVNKTWEFFELGPYKQLTYKQVQEKVHAVASGYRAIGVKEHDVIGIFEDTCLEWSLTAHAAFSQNAVIATVYSTLGEDAVAFAINQTKLSYLLTNGRLLGTLAKATTQCPTLKHIIYVDKPDEKGLEILNQRGVRTYSFDEIVSKGTQALVDPIPPSPNDVAVIMYTSGSTGNPKGVVIRHKSVAAAINSVIQGSHYDVKDDDVYISFLPLAHVLAFVAQNAMLDHGVYVGFGNPRSLVDSAVRNCRGDFAELRPTLMAGVPTIFDRIKKGARDKIEKSGQITHTLFNFAYNLKKKAIGQDADTPFWNKIVFDKLKAQMGGRIRVMLSGGAPLSQDTQEFLRVCFSCRVIQGYGLTETCGGATIQNVDDISLSIAGAPLPGTLIKLVDVEEMNYRSTSTPPQGEIWIKGANVSDGYFMDEEQTQKAFINEWFCTGDVGEWTPQGTLKIIDRVKNLVKLSHGEYIALENVESKLKNCPYVDNICAYGDGLRTNIVALVVPARQRLIEWAEANKIHYDNFESLCNHRKARSEVLSSMISAGRTAKLKTTELPKDVFLCHEEWTPQNNMLTAAMKLKRPTLNHVFKPQIEAMYAENQ